MLHVIRSLFLLLSFLLQFNHTIQSSSVSHKAVAYFNTYTICRCRHFIFTKSLSERSDTQSIPTARGDMHKSTPTYGRGKKKRRKKHQHLHKKHLRNTQQYHSSLTTAKHSLPQAPIRAAASITERQNRVIFCDCKTTQKCFWWLRCGWCARCR